MADIIVDTDKLKIYADRLVSVNNRLTKLDRRLDRLYFRVGLQGLWNLIQADALTCYSWKLSRCQSYLSQTASDFEFAERRILAEDPLNFSGIPTSEILSVLTGKGSDKIGFISSDEELAKVIKIAKSYAIPGVLSFVSPVAGLLYLTSGVACGNMPSVVRPSGDTGSMKSAEWLGYEMSDGNPGITAWLGKASAETKSNWGYAGVNAYLGKAEAEADADFTVMKKKREKEKIDGKWDEKTVTEYINAEIGASASASAIAADGEAGVGDDMLGLECKATGSVGSAKAEAKGKFSIKEDGINAYAKGEAMVSAAEGEVKGTINILGIEITGKVGGYAGALGVEGKAGIEKNKFVLRGGAAAVLGVSGGVEIGFNEEGWNNFTDSADDFVDFMKFWD